MSKITKSAKGEECTIRIPGVCSFDPEKTMFCHLGGAGMGMKHKDLFGVYGCYECHMTVDGHTKTHFNCEVLKMWFYDAMIETQEILLEKGLICLK